MKKHSLLSPDLLLLLNYIDYRTKIVTWLYCSSLPKLFECELCSRKTFIEHFIKIRQYTIYSTLCISVYNLVVNNLKMGYQLGSEFEEGIFWVNPRTSAQFALDKCQFSTRLGLTGGMPSGGRRPWPGGRDPATPRKATTGTRPIVSPSLLVLTTICYNMVIC